MRAFSLLKGSALTLLVRGGGLILLKSTVFELEQWFLHQNAPFFHQEFNGKGYRVIGSQFCTKKMKNISEFQNSWNFWIFGSWTQPGAWHMIVPFWSWILSDTTHVRPQTKYWIYQGGAWISPPPSLKCVAGTPSLLGLNNRSKSSPTVQ